MEQIDEENGSHFVDEVTLEDFSKLRVIIRLQNYGDIALAVDLANSITSCVARSAAEVIVGRAEAANVDAAVSAILDELQESGGAGYRELVSRRSSALAV